MHNLLDSLNSIRINLRILYESAADHVILDES